MSKLVLYDFGNSVCCQKVRITLRAKGLDWDPFRVNLFTNEQYDPKYLQAHPKGVVPTMVHDGKPVIELTLICEYLDETFRIADAGSRGSLAARTRMRLWSKTVDEGLFEGVTELSFSAMFRERMKSMPERKSGRSVSAMSATRAGATASARPTNWACARPSCSTPSPPSSAPSTRLEDRARRDRRPLDSGRRPDRSPTST